MIYDQNTRKYRRYKSAPRLRKKIKVMVLNALISMNAQRVTTNVMPMLFVATKMEVLTVSAKKDLVVMDLSAMMSMNVPLTMPVTKMLHVITQMAASNVNVTRDTMVMESSVMI